MGGYGIHPYKNTAFGAPPIPYAAGSSLVGVPAINYTNICKEFFMEKHKYVYYEEDGCFIGF